MLQPTSVRPLLSLGRGWFLALPLLLLLAVLFMGPASQSVVAQAVTTRVSVSSAGLEGDDVSGAGASRFVTSALNIPSIATSGDGRWVAFASMARNLFFGFDGNGSADIFLHDRQNGSTVMVSVEPNGVPGDGHSYTPVVSSNGRWVAFSSVSSALVVGGAQHQGIYLRDMSVGTTSRVSVNSSGQDANFWSSDPSISEDGNYVAFLSGANNLVPNDTNGFTDVFVRDRLTGTTSRVNVGAGGVQANSTSTFPVISADGRWVAFNSFASNLVANDTNSSSDVFVHDRQTGVTSRASVGTGGVQLSNAFARDRPGLSADGRWVAFNAERHVFLHDRLNMTTIDASAGAPLGYGHWPVLSADGRYVAFDAPGVFVYDRLTGTTIHASVNTTGAPGARGLGYGSAISADGRIIAFASQEALIAGDFNNVGDVFVRDLGPAPPIPTAPGAPTNLQASANGNNLSLSWGAPASGGVPTSYTLVARTTAGGPVLGTLPLGNVTAFAAAAPNGVFVLTLTASNAQGTGPESATVTVTLPSVPPSPAAPTNLVVSVLGNSATFSWTAPSSGGTVSNYLLVAGLTPGFAVPLGSLPLPASSTTTAIPGIPPGTYYVRVLAQNAGGTSAPTNEAPLTIVGPSAPAAPTLNPPTVTGNTVGLSWSPGGGGAPTSYVLTALTSSGVVLGSAPLAGASASFPGVPSGSYLLRLVAVNGVGPSPASNTVSLVVP